MSAPQGTAPSYPKKRNVPFPERGFVLIAVMVALVLVAAIGLMLSTEGAVEAELTGRGTEALQVDHIARAAIQHAVWQNDGLACSGDFNVPSTPFGAHSYVATVTGGGATTTYSLSADQDSWIDSGGPGSNNGGDSDLHIKGDAGDLEQPLYRFDLSSLPAGAQINSASASFYVFGEHPEGPVTVHRITAGWNEGDVTWDSISGSVDSQILATIPAQPDKDVWVQVNVTAQVQSWVNGEPNNGILLASSVAGVHAQYVSREGAGTKQPRLDVVVGTAPASPLAIQATGTLDNGITRTLNRTVSGYQARSGAYLEPVGDAYLKEDDASLNFGASSGLWVQDSGAVGEADNSVLRFEINRIPGGSEVTSATLEMYAYNDSSNASGSSIGVHRVTRDWVEGTGTGTSGAGVTWNDSEPGISWSNAGGDYDVTVLATADAPAGTTGWRQWDVTNLVNGWSTGAYSNQGMILVAENASTLVGFRSSDYSDETLRPKLTLTYACQCGSACLAPQGTGSVLLVRNQNDPDPTDTAKQALFEAWGYTVNLLNDWDDQTTYNAAMASNDVVFISGASPFAVDTKLNNAPIGVVNERGELNDELGIASGRASPVGDTVDIVDTSHYITRVFPTAPLQVMTADVELATVSGTVAPGAQQLAQIGGVGALVALDAGAMLTGGGNAAARRVFLPAGESAVDWMMTNNGQVLLQRALAWGMNADVGGSGNLLMVVVNPGNLTAQEQQKKTLIEGWSYTVNLIDESDPQSAFNTAFAANDVVFVTEDVTASNIGNKLTLATIGVVTEEANLSDELGLSASIAWESGTDIEINDNGHHITSPFSLGVLAVLSTSESLAYVTGIQAPDLQKLASSVSGYGVVTLDEGATTHTGGSAAGRRALLPWGGNNMDVASLTADGLTLFERALQWGAGTGAGAATGLYAHWKLDDGAGPTALDSVGGHDGTLVSTPAWVAGTLDGGLDFDGVNDYVDVGTFDVPGGGLTMMGWFNAETIPETDPRIISKASGPDPSDPYWQLSTRSPGTDRYLRMRIKAGGTTSELGDSSELLSPGQWYFAVGTYDAATGSMKLYLDGVEVASGSHAVGGPVDANPSVPVAIGANGSVERFFDGVLDDVRLYDRALSAAEIADLYAEGLGGPIAHWKLDDGTGPTALDSEGSHDGTLTNGPAWVAGQLGDALDFDGADDYVDLTSDAPLDDVFVGGATVMAWIEPATWGGNGYGRVFDKSSSPSATGDGWAIRLNTDNGGLNFGQGFTGGRGWWRFAEGAINLGTWQHIAVAYDASATANDPIVYLNGNPIAVTRVDTPSGAVRSDAALNLRLGAHATGSGQTFDGKIDDARVYDRILGAAEIADVAGGGGGGGGGPGYNEAYAPWSATSNDTWQAVDLAPFGVPANAVVEVAVVNTSSNTQLWGGVRAVGSTLNRRLQLHEAESGGTDVMVMTVQADASSRIEHYADTASTVTFVLLGYWGTGTFVEAWDFFNAGASDSWQDHALSAYGVTPGHVAELLVHNDTTNSEYAGGVRTDGSTAQRVFDVHEPEGGGTDMLTMLTVAGTDGGATVELFAESNSSIDFYLMGHWSTPPGAYTEAHSLLPGSPASSGAWDDKDLTSLGVPANAVAQIVMANGQDSAEAELGVRAKGSSIDRILDLQEAEAGGDDLASLHVNTDGSATIQWYDQNTGQDHRFYLVGWWVIP